MAREKEFDIAKNVRLIDWLKSELLTSVADLFKLLSSGIKGSQEAIADCIASIILAAYLLGKRLGIQFEQIDRKLEGKIRLGIIEEYAVEKDFADLSELSSYTKEGRK